MADDIFDDYTADVKKATRATKEGTEALNKLREAQETPVDAQAPDLSQVQNFKMFANDAANAQKRWTDEIRESVVQLVEQSQQIGSLRSQFRDVTGAVGGFLNKLKSVASVSNQYNLAMREFTQGSEAYTASLNLSTKAVEHHGTQAQKYMTAIQKSYNSAYEVAAKYGMGVEQIRRTSEDLQKTFSTQLGAVDNQTKALDRLRNQTIAYARLTGQDASEAIRTLDDRLRSTGMTLEEVRQEQLLVAKSLDDYKNKLYSMGEEARRTGNITSKDFLEVLKQVRGEFRQGIFDAAAFSRSLTSIAIAGKKAGLTAEESRATATGFGQLLSQAGKFSSFFGVRSAQMIEGLMGDLGQIQDVTLRRRLEFIKKRSEETGTPLVQKLDQITAAMQGSAEGQALLMKNFKTYLPQEVFRNFAQQQGNMNALQAEVLTEQLYSGELLKQQLELAKKSPEERAKEAEKFASPMEKLALQGARAEKFRHQQAKNLNAAMNRITGFVEKYWYYFALVQAGSGLAGRALSGLLGRTRVGQFLGMGAPTATGAAGATATGAARAPLLQRAGAGLRGLGGVRGVGGMALRGGLGLLGVGATATGLMESVSQLSKGQYGGAMFAAGAAPFVGGVRMGRAMEEAIGARVYKGLSGREQQVLGKDTSLTGYLATKMMGPGAFAAPGMEPTQEQRGWQMIQQETIRVDWKIFNAAKDKYKNMRAEVRALEEKRSRDGELSQTEKATLKLRKLEMKLLESKIPNMKRAVELESEEAVSARFRIDQMEDIFAAAKKIDISKISGKEGLREQLQDVVRSSARLWRYSGSEKAISSLMKTPLMGRRLKEMAQKAGVSEQDLVKMFSEESRKVAGVKQRQGFDLFRDLKTPSIAPAGAVEELKKAGQTNVQISGTDMTGTETTTETADGGIVKKSRGTYTITTMIGGTERGKRAVNDALQVSKMKGSPQTR